jgi:tetratricopeptide (TPR) repeat protein
MNPILDTLKSAWSEAQAGSGRFIHLVGNVGSGKSTLLTRFVESISENDSSSAVVSIRCGDQSLVRASDHGEIEDLVARVTEGVRVIEWQPSAPGELAPVPWLLPGMEFLTAATHVSALPTLSSQSAPPSRAEIHAGLLIDVARNHPILLVLDDVHRADSASQELVAVVAAALKVDPLVRLLIVCTSARPLEVNESNAPRVIAEDTVIEIGRQGDADISAILRQGLGYRVSLADTELRSLITKSNGNPLVAQCLVDYLSRLAVLKRGPDGDIQLADTLASEKNVGLWALAEGTVPNLRADIRADLQTAAVVGRHFSTDLMSRIWSVPEAAATIRIELLMRTGLVTPEAEGWSFLSDELASQWTDTMDESDRTELHARIGTILRVQARFAMADSTRINSELDVTETWSESRHRDHTRGRRLDSLWATARHFAAARRHGDAAEAAVTFVESLFAEAGPALLLGHQGRHSDRERRHRLYAALTEADAQLTLAERLQSDHNLDGNLSSIRVRLLTVRSRFKAVMGDFAEARGTAEMARALAGRIERSEVSLEALRVQLEVCYASGDTNAARAALVQMLDALSGSEKDQALPIYVWLSEAFAKWEWPGLHGRLFPFILDQARSIGGHQEALHICLEWLVALVQVNDQPAIDKLLADTMSIASDTNEMAFLAEQLVRRATEMIQLRVDGHYDLLSGEFYVPDLYAEGFGPAVQPLTETLEQPVQMLELAREIATETGSRLVELRVATGALGAVLETRERLTELLERWMPIQDDEQPVRLTEMTSFLADSFFSVTLVEGLIEQIVIIADELNLHQILADTVYEALDRELPSAIARAGTLFQVARESYERVGDTYGLTTLSLVEARYQARRSQDPMPLINDGIALMKSSKEQWTLEQTAFLHLRFGELLLDDEKRSNEAVDYLEEAMRLYDRAGDVDHLHMIGTILHEVYRKQGDLARYRAIRERFRGINQLAPGSDPLRLELRIEHVLSMARQEPNDERAIEMVEQCIQLFGRMPDGTTRIDECFVEISKICRRRADEAENETGFNGWLERSLEAVRIAITINRGLNNYYRVFEELHELFDDLLGLGLYDEYLHVRAENRELAFAVGNIGELLYLFEEHLHYDAETGTEAIRLPEIRSFYEALMRYLLGMGATEDARSIRAAFVGFLTALGEIDLADMYRLRRLTFGPEALGIDA